MRHHSTPRPCNNNPAPSFRGFAFVSLVELCAHSARFAHILRASRMTMHKAFVLWNFEFVSLLPSPTGHKITFSEKADEIPDGEAGDVVFVLQEQPHAEFKRKGDDLFIERTISLTEALCGFSMDL